MRVTLKHHTPLKVCSDAIRTCWQSFDKSDSYYNCPVCDEDHLSSSQIKNSLYCPNCNKQYKKEQCIKVIGKKDKELIDRVGNKFKHSSTLEHLNYNFYIQGISRALLQELSRHRITSLSVKSTRYTLKELKNEESFSNISIRKITDEQRKRAEKYIKMTGDREIDDRSILQLELLRESVSSGIANDISKYNLIESYKTELHWSINARSLQNFLTLRSDKSALWEIRDLAREVYKALPEEHKYLFSIKENNGIV